MATTFTHSGMGFALLNATTIPVQDISFTPNMGIEPFRSGGDLSPSMIRRTGGQPVFRFTAPLASVYAAMGGFGPISLTAFEMYAALFSAPNRTSAGATRWTVPSAGTTNKAYAVITGVSGAGSGIPLAMAEVTVFVAASDGLTDPIATSTASLPTLGSTPNLHVMSGFTDNTTTYCGVANWRLDIGIGMEPIQMDGLFYPTDYRVGAIQATASITHKDVVTVYNAITMDGKDSTGVGFILWARGYNMTTKVLTTTGYSFTMANAFATLESVDLSGTDLGTTVLRLTSYAAPGTLTHPVAVATAATLPT